MALGKDQSEGPDVILFPPSSLKGVDHAPGQLVEDRSVHFIPVSGLRPGYDFSYPLNVPAHCTGILYREQLEPPARVPHWPAQGSPTLPQRELAVSPSLAPDLPPVSGQASPGYIDRASCPFKEVRTCFMEMFL